MPDLTFDGRRVTVPAGTNLVEAGLQAGVPVPVFCYERTLGAVGSCRVCAVTTTVQGKSRLVMACMTARSSCFGVWPILTRPSVLPIRSARRTKTPI